VPTGGRIPGRGGREVEPMRLAYGTVYAWSVTCSLAEGNAHATCSLRS
jgi:hypothetical protein